MPLHNVQQFEQRSEIRLAPVSVRHRLQKALRLLFASGVQSLSNLVPQLGPALAGARSVVAIARTMKSSFVVFMFLYCEEGNNLVRERIYITWSSDLKCAIVPENFLYGCGGACRAP